MFRGHVDAAIGDLVRARPELIAGFSTVLVTSLDSVQDVASSRIGQEIMSRFPRCATLGEAIAIPGAMVESIDQRMGIFTGFDEVWCFGGIPDVGKPEGVSILPPPSLSSAAVPADVLDWMAASHCQLALADGFGMNYVTLDAAVERVLRDMTT